MSKLEVLICNALSMYQRNHKPFVRRMYVPFGLTPRQFGENFFMRIFLKNPLCEFEEVKWSCGNLFVKPRRGSRVWKKCSYNDAVLAFPIMHLDHLIFLTHGHYQISNVDKYVTYMRFNEFYQQMEDDPDVWEDIDFTAYDKSLQKLPEDHEVHYYDQNDPPEGWEVVKHGPWCPRRIVQVVMPSRHTTQAHITVVSFIPEGSNASPEFHRLGFREELSSILDYCCSCRIGSRLAGCCSHVATVIALLGSYAVDESGFKSKHSTKHYFDPQQPKSLNQSQHLGKQNVERADSSSSDSSDDEFGNLQDIL